MIIKNGHQYCTQDICVLNEITDGKGVAIENVTVKLDIPDGLVYASSTLPIGSFDIGTSTWNIPLLQPGVTQNGLFCFIVVDSCELPFKVNYTVGAIGGCEDCEEDDSNTISLGNSDDIAWCTFMECLADFGNSITCTDINLEAADDDCSICTLTP